MIKKLAKRITVLGTSMFLISSIAFSQIEDFDFLKSAPSDAAKFAQAYFAPWANAFGAGLNGGWYNTAKPHKFGGFDITAGVNVGVVPTSAEKFDLSTTGFSSSLSATGLTPTVAGPNIDGPQMAYKAGGVTLTTFTGPKGVEWRYIPVPTAQIGIGLPLGTELKVRYTPKITVKDGNISLWGIGVVHSIMQYLPEDKMMPFDVSLFGGYTVLEGNVNISVLPDPSVVQAYTTPYDAAVSFKGQKGNVKVSALNVTAIASLNLPVITFYGGLGYCKTKTALKFQGNFPTPVLVVPALPAAPYPAYNNSGIKTGADFPKMEIENFSGLRANIGFRIKLAVITIHADYTRAQYDVLSTGLGVSFR